MAGRMIFPNLAVKDVAASREFFTALGFEFDERFCGPESLCMIVSESASVMLLSHKHFAEFTKKSIVDSTAATECILALSAESREEVDDLVHKALAAGAKPSNDPSDMGFMYGWSFQDLDGHLWEVLYMDEQALANMPNGSPN